MSKVRAKFVCACITEKAEYNSKLVEFSAVTDGSEENKSFAKSTPSGSVSLFINNDTVASNAFEQGQEYYLDFTKVE